MAEPQYLSTDPNAGQAASPAAGGYLSTDPKAGSAPVADFKSENATDENGHALIDFGKHYLSQIDPRPLVNAARHPLDTLKAIGAAQGDVGVEAKDAFKKGDYIGAAAHALYYLIPLVGPLLDKAGNEMRAGQTAAGLGDTLGIATALFGPAKAPEIVAKLPSAADAAKMAVTGGRLVAHPVKTLVGMAADELAARTAETPKPPAIDPRTAPLPPTGKAPVLNDVLIDALNATRDQSPTTPTAPTEYPQAAADTMSLLRARQEVAAGRLSPAVLRGVERAAAQRAAASGVPAAAPAAPVEAAPAVAVQPPAAAPVVQPAPPVPVVAAPPVDAAPVAAFSPQRALNELALSARRAKTALTGTEMQTALDAVRQGATVPDALTSVLKDRLAAPAPAAVAPAVEAAPVDPAAAFAQHFNLPTDPVTTFPKGMRGASTSAGIRDPKTGQFVSSARLDELLKTKFGGTGQ